jgi:hypothetical protein
MQHKQTFNRKLLAGLGIMASAAILATTAVAQTVAQTTDKTAIDCAGPGHWRGKHSDPQAAMQKHLDKLKADLKIQANQEGAWAAYVAKVQEKGQKMKAFHDQAKSQTNLTLPERLDRRVSFMQERLADMQDVNTALKALYSALSADQQAILDKHFSQRMRHHA